MTESKKTITLLSRLALLVLFLFSLTVLSVGQTNKGAISGTVTDEQGAVVADADITVKYTELAQPVK